MSTLHPLVAKAFAATGSFPVKLRDFIMLARDKSVIICVFEGDDHFYYGPRIDAYLAEEKTRRNFPMGGKTNVRELYELRATNSDVGSADAIFFTDCDFDIIEPITNEKWYVTPCYSIENFYVLPQVLQRILTDIFKVPRDLIKGETVQPNPEFTKVMEHFLKVMDQLYDKFLIPLNAFILAAKETLIERPELKSDNQLCLQEFNLEEYLEISLRGIDQRKPMTLGNLAFSLRAPGLVNPENHKEKVDFLRTQEVSAVCRGKYTFEAFSSLMPHLWEDSRKTVPKIFVSQRQAKLSFSRSTALADLSLFAVTPPCLKQFLSTELAQI